MPCLDDGYTTNLSSVAVELGFDELSYVFGAAGIDSTGKSHAFVRASTPAACADQACIDYLETVLAAARATYEADGTTDRHDAVWTVAAIRGDTAFRALIGRRGDAFSSVTTTAGLRTFVGAVDSPWKAHLLVLASDQRYDISCRAYVGGDEPMRQTFIRAPNEILGIEPAEKCSEAAEARRILLEVDRAGTPAIRSSASLWTGQTHCD